jgi:flagellar basal-body rod protein FlgB
MSELLDSVTGTMLTKALDVSLAVHQTIANNIANASTVGYQPLKLDFQQVMDGVRTAVDSGASDTAVTEILEQLDFAPELDLESALVQLDQQMVLLAQNTTHYQALISARGQLGELVNLAIKGGQS